MDGEFSELDRTKLCHKCDSPLVEGICLVCRLTALLHDTAKGKPINQKPDVFRLGAGLIQRNGGYQFTLMANGFLQGYCCMGPIQIEAIDTPYEAVPRIESAMTREEYDAMRARQMPFKAKYHVEGHATKAEALRCFADFMLDQG
jgi:hypothetical protein